MVSKTGKRLLIVILVVVAAVLLFVAASALLDDINTPRAIGYVAYDAVDELPEGAVAVTLTEEDFAKYPALAVIFDKENIYYEIPIVRDANDPKNPTPNIDEERAHALIQEYPYVEYEGYFYKGVMAIVALH